MVDSLTYFAFIFILVETPVCVCGGGGYSDIFHTYIWLGPLFWFVIQYFKINSLWGMKKVWIFLGDHYIIGLIGGGGVFLYISGLFQGTEWESFFAVTKFKIFI